MKKLNSPKNSRALLAVALAALQFNAFADEQPEGELSPLGVIGSKEELQKYLQV